MLILKDHFHQDKIERAVSVPLSKIREALKEHWLTAIRCDHENKSDKASCACSEFPGPECPSINDAVESWIDHFITILQE